MKTYDAKRLLIAAALIGSVAFATSGAAQQERGHGQRMGPDTMMGGYSIDYGTLEQMNITTEQRDKLSAIQDGVAKKTWDLADRMRERSLRLRDLMATRPRERTAIVSEYKKLQELQLQNFRIYIDAREEMANVLAAEQQQRLQRHSYW